MTSDLRELKMPRVPVAGASVIAFGASTFRKRQAAFYNGGNGSPAHTRIVGPIDRLTPDAALPLGTALQLVLSICARRDMDEEDRVARSGKQKPTPVYPRDLQPSATGLPGVFVPVSV